MEELISVIIPAYNAENSIRKCLDSVLGQTYHNIEVLLIDDGSTDATSEICDEYERKDSRIKVLHTENGGPAKARNIGLKNMAGRYLAFVDADDYVEPDIYETLIKEIQESRADIIIFNWYQHLVSADKVSIGNIGRPGMLAPDQVTKAVVGGTNACGGGYPWNKIIDCSGILTGDGVFPVCFNEDLIIYEDMIWYLNLLNHVRKIRLTDYVGYHYNDRADSMSHKWTVSKYESMVKAWDIVAAMMPLEGSEKKRHDNEIVDAVWGICKNCGDVKQLYMKHRELFHAAKYFPALRRCLKALLVDLLYAFHKEDTGFDRGY